MPAPVEITSLNDPRAADYRNVRDADLRGGGGRSPLGAPPNKLFIAESELVVRRLIESRRFRVKSLFLSRGRFAAMQLLLESIDVETPILVAEEPLMRDIAGYRHHQGALAVGYRPEAREIAVDSLLRRIAAARECTLVLCEGLTNVDNVGAMIRSAAAFGAHGVILDHHCADPLFRLAIRVSMGHVFTVPWAVSSDWPGDLTRLKREQGIRLVAVEATRGASPAWMLPRNGRLALLFGSEKHGLSPATLAMCDDVCAIPMAAGVPSINVAAAAAVMLYERRRSLA